MDERGYPCEFCGSHSPNADDHDQCRQVAFYEVSLHEAAARRLRAAQEERAALDALNAAVQAARDSGLSAVAIAEAIGTTRQRVYEILRG